LHLEDEGKLSNRLMKRIGEILNKQSKPNHSEFPPHGADDDLVAPEPSSKISASFSTSSLMPNTPSFFSKKNDHNLVHQDESSFSRLTGSVLSRFQSSTSKAKEKQPSTYVDRKKGGEFEKKIVLLPENHLNPTALSTTKILTSLNVVEGHAKAPPEILYRFPQS